MKLQAEKMTAASRCRKHIPTLPWRPSGRLQADGEMVEEEKKQ